MSRSEQTSAFDELVRVIAKLRDPNGGCPWDLEQTHSSLKQYLIEESYEVIDAIDNGTTGLKEELGDVLLQVVLHSQIASEEKRFTIDDVVKAVTQKMISRHPHVFGDVKAKTSAQVLSNWEQNKQKELPTGKSVLDGVPRSMPGLLRAQRMGEKASRVGFDWGSSVNVLEKVREELDEFLEAVQSTGSQEERNEEFGDILFTLAQLARHLDITSEEALQAANDKFLRRFKQLEKNAEKPLTQLTADEKESLWEQVKIRE